LAAAVVAGAQIIGGYLVPHVRKAFARRTSFLVFGTVTTAGALALIGLTSRFWVALVLLGLWAIIFAATMPIRQAYINGLIPSAERATVLSSDNLFSSSGGVVVQPVLGRAAEAWGYPASYVVGAGIELAALPFVLRARREKAPSDSFPEAG
jgi:MFS family permease